MDRRLSLNSPNHSLCFWSSMMHVVHATMHALMTMLAHTHTSPRQPSSPAAGGTRTNAGSGPLGGSLSGSDKLLRFARPLLAGLSPPRGRGRIECPRPPAPSSRGHGMHHLSQCRPVRSCLHSMGVFGSGVELGRDRFDPVGPMFG